VGLRNTFVAQVATNRANACLKLNRLKDAIADAELAIAADEGFAKAYLRRAQAEERQGEWEAAVRDLNKVQELDSELQGVAEMLKHAKVELKKSKRVDYYKVPRRHPTLHLPSSAAMGFHASRRQHHHACSVHLQICSIPSSCLCEGHVVTPCEHMEMLCSCWILTRTQARRR
jgi:tetratricopeptide (TPR) repeat protein